MKQEINIKTDITRFYPVLPELCRYFTAVGRTTTLVATALTLARHGHRVAVVDLDLESPGGSIGFKPCKIQTLVLL